jgi:type I restriction enzyme S subunit
VADELIENNLRRIRILEGMARTIYREWFVNFPFSGHENVSKVNSPMGPIPKGWMVGPLGKLVELKSGFACKSKDFSPDGEQRLVTIKNVQDGLFNPECDSRLNNISEELPPYCALKNSDILHRHLQNLFELALSQRPSECAPRLREAALSAEHAAGSEQPGSIDTERLVAHNTVFVAVP